MKYRKTRNIKILQIKRKFKKLNLTYKITQTNKNVN